MNFSQAGGKAQRNEVKRSFTAEANGVFGKAENEVVRKILLNKKILRSQTKYKATQKSRIKGTESTNPQIARA